MKSKRMLILIVAPLLLTCTDLVAQETYVVDKKESVVTWKGYMQFAPKNAHVGYAYMSKGELTMEKEQLAGGMIEVDMSTLADEKYRSDNDLIEHLKSADFFDVDKFPRSVFIITKVAPVSAGKVNVTGNLIIKGVVHAITFPAEIQVKSGVMNASGKATIDRTKWDIRYGSGKFFSNLADETISDEIVLDVKIVAMKK